MSGPKHSNRQSRSDQALGDRREHELLTVPDAARALSVTPGRVRQLLVERRIAGARKVGRDWLIPAPARVLPPRAKTQE